MDVGFIGLGHMGSGMARCLLKAGHRLRVYNRSRDKAEKLAAEGIDAEIIDLRTLRPLDIETVIASVKKTNRIVTVEQAWPVCSIGSEVCSRVALDAFDYLDAPPTKVTGKDVPMPYAANLEKLALPTVEDVIQAVKSVCYKD